MYLSWRSRGLAYVLRVAQATLMIRGTPALLAGAANDAGLPWALAHVAGDASLRAVFDRWFVAPGAKSETLLACFTVPN